MAEDTHAKTQEKSICKHCGAEFKDARSKAGHISKKHPGLSESYNRKVQIAKANETRRSCLQRAKQELLRAQVDPKACRNKVTEISKLIMAADQTNDATKKYIYSVKID